MSSIVLTSAESAQVESGVIVTPGDPSDDVDRRMFEEGWAPASLIEWVAPVRWTALEGPCDRCRGNGRLWRLDRDGTAEPCPDCVNGRKRIELRKPAEHPILDALISGGYSLIEDRSVLVAHCTIERIEAAADGQFAIHLTDLEMAS